MTQVVLLSDYDGTISGKSGICKGVKKAIEELRGLGVKVIVASARTLKDMDEIINELDGAVAENGAVIYVNGTSTVLDPDGARAMREALSGLEGVYFGDAVVYVPVEMKEAVEQLLVKGGIRFSYEKAGNMVIFGPEGTDKSRGATAIIEKLNISRPYYLVSIGDDTNDISLFKISDFSVSVTDKEELKGYASLATKRHGCLGFIDFTKSLIDVIKLQSKTQQ